MKKNFLLLCSVICAVVCVTGCSHLNTDGNILAGKRTTVINGYEFPIDAVDNDNTYITADDVTYIEIGDSVRDYVYLSTEEIGEFERGVEGLTYSLNKVSIYNSIYDAGVSFDDCYDLYGEQNIPKIENNKFIVLDMTAHYDSDDRSNTSVNVALGFYEKFWNDKDFDYSNIRPSLIWFSLHPDEADEELDRNQQYFVYRIKPGESVDFQLGILAGESYIDDADVYLAQEGPDIKYEGYTYYAFRLISDKTEFEYGEGVSS